MAEKVHQVEFLVRGNLMPPTLGRLQISESFILEKVWSWARDPHGRIESFSIAFVGVVGDPKPNFFHFASEYLDFFLLIYSFTTGQPVTQFMGVGSEIPSLGELGSHRISFPDYEKIAVLDENMKSEFSKPILTAKERFLELKKDRLTIMDGHLGIALRYYHFTLQAEERKHFPETVINLAIAAEAMLSTGENFKSNLKRRISTFISENESERIEIAEKIGDFYDLRGAIVHGGHKKIPLSVLRAANKYIRRAIDKALALRIYDKEELIKTIEDMPKLTSN